MLKKKTAKLALSLCSLSAVALGSLFAGTAADAYFSPGWSSGNYYSANTAFVNNGFYGANGYYNSPFYNNVPFCVGNPYRRWRRHYHYRNWDASRWSLYNNNGGGPYSGAGYWW